MTDLHVGICSLTGTGFMYIVCHLLVRHPMKVSSGNLKWVSCTGLSTYFNSIILAFELQPFFKWCKLLEKEQKKGPESAFKLIFYSSAYAYCSYILFGGKYDLFRDTNNCWKGEFIEFFHYSKPDREGQF